MVPEMLTTTITIISTSTNKATTLIEWLVHPYLHIHGVAGLKDA